MSVNVALPLGELLESGELSYLGVGSNEKAGQPVCQQSLVTREALMEGGAPIPA